MSCVGLMTSTVTKSLRFSLQRYQSWKEIEFCFMRERCEKIQELQSFKLGNSTVEKTFFFVSNKASFKLH